MNDMANTKESEQKAVPFEDVIRRLLNAPAAPVSKKAKAKRKKRK